MTQPADQTTDWIAIGIAAAALAFSIFNFVVARRPIIHWLLVPDPEEEGPGRIQFRLVNTHDRFAAHVLSVRCLEDDGVREKSSAYFDGTLPARVDPGSSLPIIFWNYSDDVGSKRVEIRWRQQVATSLWKRWVVHKRSLYR